MPFEVVLTDPFVVDRNSQVFKLWLQCIPKDAAVSSLLASYLASTQYPETARQYENQLRSLFDTDTTDRYRMFGILER